MTCIVAIENADGVVLATDSAATDQTGELDFVDEPKWVVTPNYVAAWAGSMEFPGALGRVKVRHKRAVESPKQYAHYLVSTWRAASPSKPLDTTLLLVIENKVFYVQDDWSVYRSAHGYSAAGSGSLVALGSLFSTISKPTKERAILAVYAASMHCTTVAKPIHVLEITGKQKQYTLVE